MRCSNIIRLLETAQLHHFPRGQPPFDPPFIRIDQQLRIGWRCLQKCGGIPRVVGSPQILDFGKNITGIIAQICRDLFQAFRCFCTTNDRLAGFRQGHIILADKSGDPQAFGRQLAVEQHVGAPFMVAFTQQALEFCLDFTLKRRRQAACPPELPHQSGCFTVTVCCHQGFRFLDNALNRNRIDISIDRQNQIATQLLPRQSLFGPSGHRRLQRKVTVLGLEFHNHVVRNQGIPGSYQPPGQDSLVHRVAHACANGQSIENVVLVHGLKRIFQLAATGGHFRQTGCDIRKIGQQCFGCIRRSRLRQGYFGAFNQAGNSGRLRRGVGYRAVHCDQGQQKQQNELQRIQREAFRRRVKRLV